MIFSPWLRGVIVRANNNVDATEIEGMARDRWYSILTSLGVPESYLTGKHGACPLCRSGKDRWRWDNKDGRGTYYCNRCGAGNGLTLVKKYLGVNFPEALRRVNEVLNGGYHPVNKAKPKMSIEDVKKFLNKLWNRSTELTGSDHVSKYLHRRGLVLQPDNVRFCPDCYEVDTEKSYPSMLSRIVDKNNCPRGIHRTYLEPDVAKQANIQNPKKMTPAIGTVAGCAVRLFPVEEELIVCEGIETAIACKQLFDCPAWACLSSTILQSFEPPEGVRTVIICGDRDVNYAGQRAAYILAQKLYSQNYLVDVWLPDVIGTDFADELLRRKK